MRPQAKAATFGAGAPLRVGIGEGGVGSRRHRRIAASERGPRSLGTEEDGRVLADRGAAGADHGQRQDDHAAAGVIDDGAPGHVPQLRMARRPPALVEPLPAVVVRECAQGLHADGERRQHRADARQHVQALRQEKQQEGQDVGHHARSPALAAVPLAPAADEQPMADRRGREGGHEPALAAAERAHHPHHRHHDHGCEHEQALRRRDEQAGVPHAPRLGEPAEAAFEAVAPGRAEIDPLIEDREERRGRGPGQQRADLAWAPERDAHGQRGHQQDVRVPSGHREAQRQAGASGPRWILGGPHHAQHGHREEQHRGRVLPEGLARGPDARPEREDRRRQERVLHRTPSADGEEEGRGGEAGEKGRAELAEERGARLVQLQQGPRRREQWRREDRGQDRIDGDAVAADFPRERLGDLRVLVEVEVPFLRQAGRGALGGPRVPGPDRPAVRQEQQQHAEGDPRGRQGPGGDHPRRALERLFPGADAHQRGGRLFFRGLRVGGGVGLARGLAAIPGLAGGDPEGPGAIDGDPDGLGVIDGDPEGDAGGGTPRCRW